MSEDDHEESGIDKIFIQFQTTINEEQTARENIRNICKEMEHVSREAVTVMQVIHHDEAQIPIACTAVRELFERASNGFSALRLAVPPTDYHKYNDQWRFITQRYSFLIALTVWLERGILAPQSTVAAVLGIMPTEQKTGFYLDIEDYLIGLLHLCTELARLAVTSVSLRAYRKPLLISKFVMEVNAGFRLLNLKNDHLRKRFDVLKYDMKKIEEVIFDLAIRGLLPDE